MKENACLSTIEFILIDKREKSVGNLTMAKKKAPKQPKEATPTEDHLYAIERIQKSRSNSIGQLEYLIKWKDRPESENSWQSVNDLYSKQKSPPTNDAVASSKTVIIGL